MFAKNIVLQIVMLSTMLILIYGFYNIYILFIIPYFDTSQYHSIYWLGVEKPPTIIQVLFFGFKDIMIIIKSIIISIIIIYSSKYIKRLNK